MESTPSSSTLIDPASVPSATAPTGTPAVPPRALAAAHLPPQVVLAGIIVAAAVPLILVATLIILVISANYNLLTWME